MLLPQPTPPLWIPAFTGMTKWGRENDRLEEAGRTVAGDKPQRDATLSTLGWCWDDDPHPGRLVSRPGWGSTGNCRWCDGRHLLSYECRGGRLLETWAPTPSKP